MLSSWGGGRLGSSENRKYYGLNGIPSKNSYVEALTPNVMVFVHKASKEVIKIK